VVQFKHIDGEGLELPALKAPSNFSASHQAWLKCHQGEDGPVQALQKAVTSAWNGWCLCNKAYRPGWSSGAAACWLGRSPEAARELDGSKTFLESLAGPITRRKLKNFRYDLGNN